MLLNRLDDDNREVPSPFDTSSNVECVSAKRVNGPCGESLSVLEGGEGDFASLRTYRLVFGSGLGCKAVANNDGSSLVRRISRRRRDVSRPTS